MNEFNIRPAKTGDIPALVSLMNSNYNRKKQADYFQWQIFESVYPTTYVTAHDKSELIGMFGMQKKKLSNGLVAAQIIDMLLNQAYRGKGVAKKMADSALSFFPEADLVCVFPNATGKQFIERAYGWQSIARIDDLRLDLATVQSHEDHPYRVPAIPAGKISFQYSEEIINWRFNANPDYHYYEFRNPAARLFSKIFIDPLTSEKTGDIVYYEDLPGPDEGFFNIVRECIDFFKKNGIHTISTWAMNHTMHEKIFHRMGFRRAERERYFMVHVKNPDNSFLYDPGSWHLMQSDTEIY